MEQILSDGLIPYIFFTYDPDTNALTVNPVWLMLGFVVVIAAAYFIGSLNFGVILSRRFFGGDVRDQGSGNAGTSNMLRTYGKRAAALTLAGDAFKGAAACLLGILLMGGFKHQNLLPGGYAAGLFSIFGHAYPAYYKFKGGKGVVTLAMMILCTQPYVFLAVLAIYLIIVAGTKFMSLGAIIGSMIYPVLLNRIDDDRGLHQLIALIAGLFVAFLHRENIKRLLNGTESKVSFRKKKGK